MLLENNNAIIYGGGGAVARKFACEGARVFLAGHTLENLQTVADDITSADGKAKIAVVDTMDAKAVNEHADSMAAKAGSIDIALNAVGILHVQGPPLEELSLEDYAHPITAYTRTNFLTAEAVARHMVKRARA